MLNLLAKIGGIVSGRDDFDSEIRPALKVLVGIPEAGFVNERDVQAANRGGSEAIPGLGEDAQGPKILERQGVWRHRETLLVSERVGGVET